MKRHPTAAALLFVASASVASAHCALDDTTGRQRVSFDVVARGLRAEADTSTGWHVRIESAYVALGPVRWFEGEALFGALRRLVAPGVAWAHPGHYVPGGALADVMERRVVDLLAPSGVAIGRATGVSGEVGSAHLELHPADDGTLGARDLLRGGSLALRGTATRGGVTVRFEAAPRLVLNIEGVPARATLDGSPGAFEVGIDLAALVDRADFAELPRPALPGAAVVIPEGSQPANALFRGAASGASYRLTWRPTAN